MGFKNCLLLIIVYSFFNHCYSQKRIPVGYQANYIAKIIDLSSKKYFTEKIILKREKGTANGGQEKIVWKYTPNKNVDSTIIKKIFKIAGRPNSQMKYKSNWLLLNTLYNTETTGLIENKKDLWIHPPRTKWFQILEFTAFPELKSPDSTYKSSIRLGGGYGKFTGMVVNSKYHVVSRSKKKSIVVAYSSSPLGKTTARFVIDKHGFSKMTYWLFGKFKIMLDRKKVVKN